MNIQIFGSKKSNDSKKAERWFKERRIKSQAVDQRIADCPAVFNAPIVRNGKQATVGYCPDIWKTWE